MSKNKNSGQVLLIVVLILIVVLTVGLSIASRSITSLRTSTQEIASQKALDAAEAGIEQSLKSQTGTTGDVNFGIGTNLTYTTSVDDVTDKEIILNGGNIVPKDDGIDLWLSKFSSDPSEIYSNTVGGQMVILWGDKNKTNLDCATTGANATPAIEISVLFNKSNPYLKRWVYDNCSASRKNGFSSPDASNNTSLKVVFKGKTTVDYLYKSATIDLRGDDGASQTADDAVFARITPLYSNTIAGAKMVGSEVFPSQGTIITSTGTAKNEGTKRTIQAFQGYPKIPTELFPYTIFSP
ncbi:MAG: hypothetical protein US77_C0012G0015 [Microgenomates group bacterium GW2011_GWC1_38_14]|nr:MAG: hypothetical protein US77_C0012G0015 [Microgenomates group bacterium GW2011_GWC1_38_14]KKR16294.1 MAG: hypothetical protein UT44_C0016G0012 [Candidatus Levybacteria bacterium GW2011_GWA1_39_32]OGH44345.1 MAG: hypothetical protein A3I49_01840 [Candidatus Levybacteria bacterium RIFCSPLOWO2_02_FULL_37_11]HBB76963.1 hypothetical protein [Candidatus Levybacteria bacterium]